MAKMLPRLRWRERCQTGIRTNHSRGDYHALALLPLLLLLAEREREECG